MEFEFSKCLSNLFLNKLIEADSMTKAGRAFQSETTRFDKKSSLGVKFVTSCRLILCE